jgi:hypothetical protein
MNVIAPRGVEINLARLQQLGMVTGWRPYCSGRGLSLDQKTAAAQRPQ